MSFKRVVVTGMGVLSPIGNNLSDYWESLKKGIVGIDFIKSFDTSEYKAKLGAEVKDFDKEKYLERKETKRMDLFSQYAIYAAGEAIAHSGLTEEAMKENPRIGVMCGSGIGGLATMEEQIIRLNEKGPSKVGPLFIPMAIANMAAGNIATKFGITGICTSSVTACASSANCIGEAYRNIKHGYSDIILAGGSEASITGIGIAGFTALTALSLSEDPKRASIPFDEERNGFIMGEGAGMLVLEEYEHAVKRGAMIYGEVVGYGSNCDAYHMTSPRPDGSGAALAMEFAVREAGIAKEEIGYINAHGTSTPPNDLAETNAIKLTFGDHAYHIPVTSTKSMMGHLLGAAGAVEAIACIEALRHGFIPPTAGLEKPGEGCDLNYVPKKGIEKDIKYAISNSFGFGGHNAVICLKKWEE